MRKRFFTTNIELKLASLILAIALWFFVIMIGRSEITIDIPIIFTNIPEKLEVVDSPQKVSVTIEGQERIVKQLKQSEINAVIDLNESKAGRAFFTLSRDNIKLPQPLVITNIDPETVSLMIETRLKKVVSVKPYVVGLPERGFAIIEIGVNPEKITVEGPNSIVKKIRTIKTEPIDISGINNNLKYKATLDIANSNIRTNINKVEVTISVRKIK